MKLIDLKLTDGPNYWSIRRKKLIVMLLDLEELEQKPTNTLPGFLERLSTLIPSLYEHRCSEGHPGGFFERVKSGTWMGHVIEHIALEIQTLAGMQVGFGRTRGAGADGKYYVVFSYEDVEAGKYAAEASVRIAEALINNKPYDLNQDLQQLRNIHNNNQPGPSTAAIVREAENRGIPVIRLNKDSLVQLGYGKAQRRIETAVASSTSNIAVDLAADKDATKCLLAEGGIPVPEGLIVRTTTDLQKAIDYLAFPLVIKPLDGNHGRGATMNIRNAQQAAAALELALKHSAAAVAERYITGQDFRALCVNYRFTAAAKRTPAAVTGDGILTLSQLVDKANTDPRRGIAHDNILTKIDIDQHSTDLIEKQGYTIESVIPKGKRIFLKATANLSTGGTAEDVTDLVHPQIRLLCERASRIIGLDICGIDIVAPDLTRPLTENGGAIIEVNAGPGLRMHLHPSFGKPRNVAAPILDMLFPDKSTGRIPIISITGTNGKTTTTRLIAHIAKTAGLTVGCTTTEGVYIDGNLIVNGDCTGSHSARMILKDPAVDVAVLECARGGILRSGLGFDQCDVGVITNIAEDHLGMQGIDTLEKLTRVKATVAHSVAPSGYAVLNADDPNVYQLRDQLECNVALFSMNADSPQIRQHVREGGIAAIYENGFLTIVRDGKMLRLVQAEAIPISFSGMAQFNIANALAASLAAFVQGQNQDNIRQGLLSFIPSPETTPGRMNRYDFGGYHIIVDYAHNTHGLKAISSFLTSIPASRRIGVIAGVGDRRNEDIISLGAEAAGIFDEIIIRQDDDLRGRTAEDLNSLVIQGIRQTDASKKITVVPDEKEAALFLLQKAVNGMLGVFFADNIPAITNLFREAIESGKYSIQQMEVA